MTEKERQQLLTGLRIWNLELKPEVGRRAKKREPIFGRRPTWTSERNLGPPKTTALIKNHHRG
jgi:hypothetical protein